MIHQAESLKVHFVRGALGSGILGLVHKGLGLLIAILLARILGAEGFGYYAFALGVVGILAVPAQLGLPQLITRELAASHVLEQWDLMRGLRRRAVQISAAAILLAMIFGFGLLAYSDHVPAIDPLTFLVALVLLPLMVSMELLGSILRGLRRIVQAMWPIAAFKPAVMVILLVGLTWHGLPLRASDAMLINLLATVASIIVLTLLTLRHWPLPIRDAGVKYQTRQWLRSLLPFTLLGAANIITQRTDIVMLGLLAGPSDVGVYQVVVQGAMLVSFGFMAMNAVLSPNIARIYAQRDTARLQQLMATTSAIIFSIALIAMVLLVIFGEALLHLVFGEEYRRGYLALLILGFGQFVNASVGSVGTFLSMTGYERDTLRAIVTAAIVNVGLNALLIPAYGLAGAATATMIATVLWNGIMALAVYKRLGVIPGPIQLKTKFRKLTQ